jgi:hypothetical protein
MTDSVAARETSVAFADLRTVSRIAAIFVFNFTAKIKSPSAV